ncbi:winged helix-turn-helix domain-containing protein [Micromonospora fluostatini]|uniref:winged helix-turn-helix domain-containing protein n=1 Tax=Micromonospora sp. JCM 30529 TaxID=3421643 RepID=UPI003D183DAE
MSAHLIPSVSREVRLDTTSDPGAEASALDKVAAALADVGPDTAAAIAQRAGVGYSTATKRLRVLEDTGLATSVRAGDGRTLWQRTDRAAADTGDDAPVTTTGADPPRTPASDEAEARPEPPDGAPAPEEGDASSPVATGDVDGPTGGGPDGVDPPTSGNANRPASENPPGQPDGAPSGPAVADIDREGEKAAAAGTAHHSVTVDTSGAAAGPGHAPAPAGTHHPTPPGSPAEAPTPSGGATSRRSKGSLRGAVRDVLEAHPDRPFKTSQLCRAIDTANEGSGSAKASAGAVVNAVHTLVAAGIAVQVAERPAAFQLAPKTD